MRIIALGAALLIVGLVCSVGGKLWASEFRVERDGTGDYTTLITALGAAVEGDTILVGAGRYSETQDVVLGCCWAVTAYAPVAAPEITIIGSGRDVTVIGPVTPAADGSTNVGIGTLQPYPGLRIESLTVENVDHGVVSYGELDARDLIIRDISGSGMFLTSSDTVLVTSTSFERCTDRAIQLSGAPNAWIADCGFSGQSTVSVDLWNSQNVYLDRSRSVDAWVALNSTQSSSLVVRDCHIKSRKDPGGVSGNGSLLVFDSYFEGDEAALFASGGGRVEFHRSQLVGHQATVFLHFTPDVLFSENDLVSNGQWVVWLSDIYDMNGQKLDFRNNWWGTTDVDSIQSWILDADNPIHDNDPREEGYVEFLPILGESVPTKSKSVGGLKGRFRGSRAAKN